MGVLPERFPILERVAAFAGRRAFAVALKLFFLRNPKLVPLAPLVLYSTLGKTLGPGLQSAAVLWASAHFYAKRHPAAVRRAGISGKDLGEALFERLITSADGTIFSEHEYSDSFDFVRYPDGKIHLAIPELLEQLEALGSEDASTDREYPFTLMAGERRSYNANTIFRDPKWRKTDAQGALRIHPDDATSLGLAEGDAVAVHSRAGSVQALVEHNDAMQPGVLSLPHGYGLRHPGDSGRSATGPLINELTSASHCDKLTKTPFHKTVPVRLEVIES
jgi:anaerobic selenocysteine-containing dehydrogenase